MQDPTETENKSDMPHSVTPEATSADESLRTVSQVDNVKSEPETQDVSMDDAPSPAATEKPKVNLEELFDDEDSDEEFPSSAPAVKSEEELSQPAPLYVHATPPRPAANNTQQDLVEILLLRPRSDACLLPAALPLSSALPMA
jgi:hypothetical protein